MPDSRAIEAKLDRERRLQWQSKLLLALVLVFAAAGLVRMLVAAQTTATAEGLAICAAFGLLVWRLRAATPMAAVTGFLLTSCMYVGTVEQPSGSWRHTALSAGLALFVLAFAATRFRRTQKEKSGLAESRRGRSASQVAANMGAAALVAVAFHGSRTMVGTILFPAPFFPVPFFPVLIAALAEAAADTVSSEVGQAIGGRPWLVTTLQQVQPGTDGAISLAGTLAGLVAAAMVVLTAVPTLRLDARQASVAWLAAVCGFLADSLIGATLERRAWLNNDLVNFLSTAIAALLAAAFLTF